MSSIIALPHSTTRRNQHMDVAYVSALSALPDSMVGGLTFRLHDLGEPTRPGQGRPARPRSVAPGGPIRGFHRRGIESIWRGPHEQQGADSGAHRPLRHDQ
jgi:hypothetical protein